MCSSSGISDTSKKSKHVGEIVNVPSISNITHDFSTDWNYMYSAMSYAQPPFGMPPPPPFLASPQRSPGYSGHSQHATPSWASKLLDDMTEVKQKLQHVEKIEKTVNVIHIKVTDMEAKLSSMESRISDTERLCEFISNENDEVKRQLTHSREEIKNLKKSCQHLEHMSKTLQEEKSQTDDIITNMEMQSLQSNLLFYGIPEDKAEDCTALVKALCKDTLQIPEADTFTFERVQRLGKKKGEKARPILVRFHYLDQRDKVRSASFDLAEDLKDAGRGVEIQLPRSVREARKPLYAHMEAAKKDRKTVKFIGKKLFINNVEHKKQPSEITQ